MGTGAVCHPSPVARSFAAFLLVLGLLSGCGSDDPESTPADPAQLEGAPPPIAALHDQGNELLDGGAEAFKARLAELKGYPVVVNKWASWCPPCRSEFPYFQKQSARLAKKVAFIGVDSNDNDDDAREFLEEYPVSYPTYKDPTVKVAETFKGQIAWPTTAYYDSKGELAYVKQGAYLKEQDFVDDLKRYAR
jgi:cytochrome c biogenesis protein CcmG, thiol:disulfide interchange protein DsbE